jgi:hypothetical protein
MTPAQKRQYTRETIAEFLRERGYTDDRARALLYTRAADPRPHVRYAATSLFIERYAADVLRDAGYADADRMAEDLGDRVLPGVGQRDLTELTPQTILDALGLSSVSADPQRGNGLGGLVDAVFGPLMERFERCIDRLVSALATAEPPKVDVQVAAVPPAVHLHMPERGARKVVIAPDGLSGHIEEASA